MMPVDNKGPEKKLEIICGRTSRTPLEEDQLLKKLPSLNHIA